MFLLWQAKTGLSALAPKRHLGVSYRTAWLLHHKVMAVMAAADAQLPLEGSVVVDDAHLGGERPGKPGRGSPNKVPFVAAVQLDAPGTSAVRKACAGAQLHIAAIADWARMALLPDTNVLSHGLGCFAGVIAVSPLRGLRSGLLRTTAANRPCRIGWRGEIVFEHFLPRSHRF